MSQFYFPVLFSSNIDLELIFEHHWAMMCSWNWLNHSTECSCWLAALDCFQLLLFPDVCACCCEADVKLLWRLLPWRLKSDCRIKYLLSLLWTAMNIVILLLYCKKCYPICICYPVTTSVILSVSFWIFSYCIFCCYCMEPQFFFKLHGGEVPHLNFIQDQKNLIYIWLCLTERSLIWRERKGRLIECYITESKKEHIYQGSRGHRLPVSP